LVPRHLLLVFGDAIVELHYLLLGEVDLLGDSFVPPGLGHHVLLNALFVVHVSPGHLVELPPLEGQLLAYFFVVSLLMVYLVHIDSLALLLQVG